MSAGAWYDQDVEDLTQRQDEGRLSDELTDLGDGHGSLEEHDPLPAFGERLHLGHPLLERGWLCRSFSVLVLVQSTVVCPEAETRLRWEPLTNELPASSDARRWSASLAMTDRRFEDG